MKKVIISVLVCMSAMVPTVSNAADGIENYEHEADQYAYCAGAFISSATLAQRLGKTDNVPTLKSAGMIAAKRALDLDSTTDHTIIARDAAKQYDLAIAGNHHAQTVIRDDLNACVILLKLLK